MSNIVEFVEYFEKLKVTQIMAGDIKKKAKGGDKKQPAPSGGDDLQIKSAIKDKDKAKVPVTDSVKAEGKPLGELKGLPDPKNIGHRGLKDKTAKPISPNVAKGKTAPAKLYATSKGKSKKSSKKSSKSSRSRKASGTSKKEHSSKGSSSARGSKSTFKKSASTKASAKKSAKQSSKKSAKQPSKKSAKQSSKKSAKQSSKKSGKQSSNKSSKLKAALTVKQQRHETRKKPARRGKRGRPKRK